mgnify:CR=1 FL=1
MYVCYKIWGLAPVIVVIRSAKVETEEERCVAGRSFSEKGLAATSPLTSICEFSSRHRLRSCLSFSSLFK